MEKHEFSEGKKGQVPPVVEQRAVGLTDDEKLWTLFSHLGVFLGVGILAPLIIWLVKKDSSEFVDDQAKEALNFQLSVYLVIIVCGLSCVLSPLAVVVAVAGMVYSVLAAIESYKGVYYRYPYTFRMIR